MGLNSLRNQAVTVQPRSIVADTSNYDVEALENYGSAVTEYVYWEQAQTGTDDDGTAVLDTNRLRLVAGSDTVLDGLSLVTIAGEPWTVDGTPWPVHNPRTRRVDHFEATLVRTQ